MIPSSKGWRKLTTHVPKIMGSHDPNPLLALDLHPSKPLSPNPFSSHKRRFYMDKNVIGVGMMKEN